MKTLSFHELKIGRGRNTLLELDSARDGVAFGPGLHLVVAPNGMGKSTLLMTLAGVIPALAGELRGDDITLAPEKQVLYVSEYLTFPKFLYPREWVEFMSERSFDATELERWVKGLRLEAKLDSYLGRMSQGERRKVTWLGAQASRKPVLLLDEPLDGLDLLAIRTAREMARSWREQGRIACVVAHQVGELLDLSDEVWLIREKKLISWRNLHGAPAATLSSEEFRNKVLHFYGS